MDSLKNTSYFFLPFVYEKRADFRPLIDALAQSDIWEPVHDKIMYMLKYVADKIDSRSRDTCQCFHYALKDSARKQFALAESSDFFSTVPRPFHGKTGKIRFQIQSVQLYCFSTTVGILAFQVCFENSDPFEVANAQFYLKKISREMLFSDVAGAPVTMLSLSEALVHELSAVSALSFFYYANPSTERANVLTYIEAEPKDDYQQELFYLRRCYSDGYLYTEDAKLDAEEIFRPSRDTVWGFSPEAAVCLVCPAMGRRGFLQNTFYKNFNAQYLFMYVLLLHQKYVLYMFLTRLGVGTYNDLETLEDYRRQLYEFETDFVFSCVTEVPQYQYLYERMTAAFSLKKMYEDVHEPLISLREIRRETAENAQKKRDANVNRALLMLSVLSFFSALVDSFDFADSFFGMFLGRIGVLIVQGVFILIIVINLILVFKNLFDSKKRKNADRE